MVKGSDARCSLVAPLGSALTGVAPDDAIVWFLATDLVKLLARDPVESSRQPADDSGPEREPDVVPSRVARVAA